MPYVRPKHRENKAIPLAFGVSANELNALWREQYDFSFYMENLQPILYLLFDCDCGFTYYLNTNLVVINVTHNIISGSDAALSAFLTLNEIAFGFCWALQEGSQVQQPYSEMLSILTAMEGSDEGKALHIDL